MPPRRKRKALQKHQLDLPKPAPRLGQWSPWEKSIHSARDCGDGDRECLLPIVDQPGLYRGRRLHPASMQCIERPRHGLRTLSERLDPDRQLVETAAHPISQRFQVPACLLGLAGRRPPLELHEPFRRRQQIACGIFQDAIESGMPCRQIVGGAMAHQLLDGSRIRDACPAECGVTCLLRVRDSLVESSALFVVDALLLLEVRLPIDPRPNCIERFLDRLPGPCQASRSESMPAPLVFEASGLLLDCVNEPSFLGVRHHRRPCLLRDFLRHSRIAHLPQRFAAFDQRLELRLTRGGRVRGRLTAHLPDACRDVPQQTDGVVLLLAPCADRDRNGRIQSLQALTHDVDRVVVAAHEQHRLPARPGVQQDGQHDLTLSAARWAGHHREGRSADDALDDGPLPVVQRNQRLDACFPVDLVSPPAFKDSESAGPLGRCGQLLGDSAVVRHQVAVVLERPRCLWREQNPRGCRSSARRRSRQAPAQHFPQVRQPVDQRGQHCGSQ